MPCRTADDSIVVEAGIIVGDAALEIDLVHLVRVQVYELWVDELARLVYVGDGVVVVGLLEARLGRGYGGRCLVRGM